MTASSLFSSILLLFRGGSYATKLALFHFLQSSYFPFHPLSSELETHPFSFHWEMDKICKAVLSCYAQQAGYLHLPSLYNWSILILCIWFLTISVDPYGLVIFGDKGPILKVIAAMLIGSNSPLVPGINHYCLCSLAEKSNNRIL